MHSFIFTTGQFNTKTFHKVWTEDAAAPWMPQKCFFLLVLSGTNVFNGKQKLCLAGGVNLKALSKCFLIGMWILKKICEFRARCQGLYAFVRQRKKTKRKLVLKE